MDFDPDQYLKKTKGGGFDPDAYLASKKNNAPDVLIKDPSGAGQAALEHFGNAATMGYLPQLQAGLQPAMNKALDLVTGNDVYHSDDSTYLNRRDQNIDRQDTQKKEHPIASTIGTVGGIGASALVPGAAIAKEASLGAKMLQGGKSGLMLGALANPGDTEGEIHPIQPAARLVNAGIGFGIGTAAPAVMKVAGTAADKVKNYLSNKAALKATRALGRPTPTIATKMAKSGQDVELGRTLLDEGAIPVFGSTGRIANRVEGIKDKAGQEIGDLLKSGGESKMIDAQKIGADLLDHPDLAQARMTPGMESTATAIENQIETLAKNGEMTLEQAHKLRMGIDKSINLNKSNPATSGAEPGLRLQRNAINDALNDSVNQIQGTGADALKGVNRKFSNLSRADEILERETGRNQTNDAISLKDLATAAATPGHGAIKLAAGAASKFGRTFGNSIQARVYDSIAKKAGLTSGALANVNPQVVSAIATRMAEQPSNEKDDSPILNNPKLMELFKQDPSLMDAIEDEAVKAKVKRKIAGGK